VNKGKLLGNNLVISKGKKFSRGFIEHHRNFGINVGKEELSEAEICVNNDREMNKYTTAVAK
jgi:hypothetical protein